jgi:flagellar assembly protein FliH
MQPFTLQSFEDEAKAIVSQARAKAKELLTAALAEQAKIREQARREGIELGRAEGRAAAEPAERKRLAEETAGLSKVLEEVMRSIEAKRGELLALAERDLVRLAVAIAEKIVKAEIAAGKPVAAENVKRAIELVARKDMLEVRVHPDDYDQVERFLPRVRTLFTEIQELTLVRSDDVSRGGCVVVTRHGAVDADVRTQLEEIERGLLG